MNFFLLMESITFWISQFLSSPRLRSRWFIRSRRVSIEDHPSSVIHRFLTKMRAPGSPKPIIRRLRRMSTIRSCMRSPMILIITITLPRPVRYGRISMGSWVNVKRKRTMVSGRSCIAVSRSMAWRTSWRRPSYWAWRYRWWPWCSLPSCKSDPLRDRMGRETWTKRMLCKNISRGCRERWSVMLVGALKMRS